MKKITQLISALALLVLVSGCSKSNYDKWLTSGTWNLTSTSLDTKTVKTTTYPGATATNNDTKTDETTTTLSGGNQTIVAFSQDAPANGTTASSTTTSIDKVTTTYAFDKSGTYTQTSTDQQVSTQTTTSPGTVGPVHNITSNPTTTTTKDDWAWLEDGAIKDQIQLNQIGNVMIKLTKSSMTLTYNNSTTNTTTLHDNVLGVDYTYTVTTTNTNTWTFSK